ncbi:MAG: HEAT repeat domain-containing protein, partial [Planctomycetota bacterium]
AILQVRRIIWHSDEPPDGALDIFIEGMADPDSGVRAMSAVGAGDLGAAGLQAVPRLIELTQDAGVTWQAAYALGRIGPGAHEAVPALVNILQSSNSTARRHAAVALAKIGPVADDTVGPALVDMMAGSAAYARWAAIWAIGELGVNSAEARSALIAALADDDTDIRAAAANALSKIHPTDAQGVDPHAASSQAVPALIHMLDSSDLRTRWSAIWALGEARAAALSAVPKLQELLADADTPPALRAASLNALGKISPNAAAVLAVLQQAVTSDNEVMRNVAVDRLRDAGHPVPESAD